MEAKQRLILTLAASELSDLELESLQDWLSSGRGRTECFSTVREIRSLLRTKKLTRGSASLESASPRENRPVSLTPLLNQLLRHEAGLTTRRALSLLANQTRYSGEIPEKTSFAEGIRRIIQQVGASKTLSAAHRIRNQVLHSPTASTWPLSDDDPDS
jgi:hypothetical protein